jgi:hypothetical protein
MAGSNTMAVFWVDVCRRLMWYSGTDIWGNFIRFSARGEWGAAVMFVCWGWGWMRFS